MDTQRTDFSHLSPEVVDATFRHAMERGYILLFDRVENGSNVRLITRPDFIRQKTERYIETFKKATLDYLDDQLAELEGKPADAQFEEQQLTLPVLSTIDEATNAGIAAADQQLAEDKNILLPPAPSLRRVK